MSPPVSMIMQQLAATQAVELTCDEILRLMDECAEAALQGGDISALMPIFQQHLEMCTDCREEFEGLAAHLAGATRLTPARRCYPLNQDRGPAVSAVNRTVPGRLLGARFCSQSKGAQHRPGPRRTAGSA